jgi:CTP:molybdopterin cytidylyltransferase MocA
VNVAADAVVLAGGAAVRMRPLTWAVPKPLLPLGRVPLLHHVLDELGAAGFRSILVVLASEQSLLVARHVETLRTAGPWPWESSVTTIDVGGVASVCAALRALPPGAVAPAALVAHCDELASPALSRGLAEACRRFGAPAIGLHVPRRVEGPAVVRLTGILERDDAGEGEGEGGGPGRGRLIGRLAVTAALMDALRASDHDPGTLLGLLRDHQVCGPVLAVRSAARYVDVGTIDRYTAACRAFAAREAPCQ